MPQDFLKKQNHRGSAAQIFFGPRGCKTFEKCTYTYACFPPFTGKRGQLGKNCNFRKQTFFHCIRFVWKRKLVFIEKERKEGKGGGRRKRRRKEKGREGKSG